jgi:hypothetical protein
VSAVAVRRAVLVLFLACIPAMIVSSVQGASGAAVTWGLIATAASVVLIVTTAVTTGRIPPTATSRSGNGGEDEERGRALEARISELVAAGADEAEVRALVSDAVRFGRSLAPPRT